MTGTTAPSGDDREASLLTGPDAGDILRTAVDAAGGQLLDWRAEQVDTRARGAATAAYTGRVRWPDGHVREERFGTYTGTPPAGATVVGDGADRVTVWRLPHDPFLPGLAAAYDPQTVTRLLRSFGYGDGAAPATVTLRAYRPRRRAVVAVRGADGHQLYLKVVRSSQVTALHQRHRLCTRAGVPVPPSLGYTDDGLLVLQALPGITLRQALRRHDATLPPPAAVLQILDALPPELATAPPEGTHPAAVQTRRSWLDRAGDYAASVAAILPQQADEAHALAAALHDEAPTGPVVPVHGDFYENQLRVAGGRICGLLDIDTAGPGDRLDDLGCLLGHLSVLSGLEPGRAEAVSRLGARYLAAFDRTVDPAALRYRVAAVVLSLTPGPYRVQDEAWPEATAYRLDLARRWLDHARGARLRKGPLSQLWA